MDEDTSASAGLPLVARIEGGAVFDGGAFRDADVDVCGCAFGALRRRGGRCASEQGEAVPQVQADYPAGAQPPDPAVFPQVSVVDARGCYVIPGLVDVHFHGCVGHDLSDGSSEGLHAIAAHEAARGVTSICPATMTLPFERLAPAMESAAAFQPAAEEAQLVGINMEGPYISPHKVGAQNPAYVRPADLEEFRELQARAHGLIRIVDVAPEEPGNLAFVSAVCDEVPLVSVAHTCADYACTAAAFDAGARHVTHLFNAMPPLHHRTPGPIAAAAERDDVTAELICDGVHVHPAMVRLAFEMFGDDRIVMVSDSLRGCGLGDGTYELGGQTFTVAGPRATLADGTLAGSVSDLAACLRTAVLDMGIPLVSAVKAASANPARALGLAHQIGAIAPGRSADAVLLDQQTLEVRHVILRGRLLR